MFVNDNLAIYLNVKKIRAQQRVHVMRRNAFWEDRRWATLSIFIFLSWIFFR